MASHPSGERFTVELEKGTNWWGAFVIGLIATPAMWIALTGTTVGQTVVPAGPVAVVAGLLVGFGAVWGSGCTSGHGVCGLARLSPRSMVAVGTFMATAVATVLVVRHVL